MLVTVAINQLLILQEIYNGKLWNIKVLRYIMIIRYSYHIFSNAATEMFWASTILWKGFTEIDCIHLKFVLKFMQKDNSSIAIESTTWVLQRSFSREYQLHYQNLSSYVRLSNLRVMGSNDVQLRTKIRVNVHQNVSKSYYVLLVVL